MTSLFHASRARALPWFFRAFAALAGAASAAHAGGQQPATPAAAPSYNFSPVNQYNLQVSASFWNPIIRYVSARSGVRLNLKLGRTSADTTSFILALTLVRLVYRVIMRLVQLVTGRGRAKVAPV